MEKSGAKQSLNNAFKYPSKHQRNLSKVHNVLGPDVAAVKTLLQMFPEDKTVDAADRTYEYVCRFLKKAGLEDPNVLTAVKTSQVDLDNLLDWACGRDKNYFKNQLALIGFAHAAQVNRVYTFCVTAIDNPEALK